MKQFEYSSASTLLITKNSTKNESLIQIGRTIISPSFIDIRLMRILIQVFRSCFAGVYTEYLLKNHRSAQVDVMLQNTFMYTNSIICNISLLVFFDQQQSVTAADKLFNTSKSIIFERELLVPLIILNNVAIGLVTSLFHKLMDSILKTFASALELLFTSVLAWILFSIPISSNTFLAIIVVFIAMYLYSTNPVVNLPKTSEQGELITTEIIKPNSNVILANTNEYKRL
ncbi:unnamed protein product [Adineta steineri]|uniref:Uncharacterized protein n=2 Tax=Adineta steineri TaxID=433720 RepID=A0A815FYL2_9BILA|nr:unnamed protein product [Adineta steineri]CAF1331583.1 unnamed protein product [Adineta steineri]CAF3602411.1 unnamed protein product [Adineta steineri]